MRNVATIIGTNLSGHGNARLSSVTLDCSRRLTPMKYQQEDQVDSQNGHVSCEVPIGAGPAGGSGGLKGVKEFTVNGSFVVPPGVHTIEVELWGGGGFAGGETATPSAGGGGGGSGAYTHTVIPVTPGATLTVTVGGPTMATMIAAGTNTLACANGGLSGVSRNGCGNPGAGGVGGAMDTTAMISRGGNPGATGTDCTFGIVSGVNGAGGSQVMGQSNAPVGTGQGGGSNGSPGPGYAFIKW